MTQIHYAWILFSLYIIVTVFLALRGMKKTSNFSSFALGKKDMGPILVGITLASSIASSATFVINPGFVYTHGVSALFHFAVASPAGFLLALVVMSKRFRQVGNKNQALTLPHWIENRFKSPALGSYFAILNLVLSITFVVLIVKGSALVMQHTLDLSYFWSLVLIVGFVFSYIALGGTYAHAYTNAFQGMIMALVAVIIVASGWHYFADGISGMMSQLAAINPNLVATFNTESALYGNVWEVFVCSFLISLGLVCQPHILMKSMYLKSDKQVNQYLIVGIVVSVVFAGLLLTGLYARLSLGSDIRQDAVVASYIAQAFSPFIGVVISVALLAAGMSTLDGILVGSSTIAANDIVLGSIGSRFLKNRNREQKEKLALSFSRWILLVMGVVSFIIALNPPKLVGIFAQAGIYGLTAASIVPIAGGIFWRGLTARSAFLAAVVGPLVHFSIYWWKVYGLGEILNPAVSASIGIVSSVVVAFVSQKVFHGAKDSESGFASSRLEPSAR